LSGLRYLADMSIDSLKIDQSFVSCLAERDNAPIVDAIIALGQRLDLDIVAEGVETKDQLTFLLTQGCTRMQGYFFGRPCPPNEIEEVLRRDDRGDFDWRAGDTAVVDITGRGNPARRQTAASGLLNAICHSTHDPLDLDTSSLPELLAALSRNEIDAGRSATIMRMTRRVAAGTCVGLVPLVAGLAAADALPNPVQNAVAATARTVGLDFPQVKPAPAHNQDAMTTPASTPSIQATNAPHTVAVSRPTNPPPLQPPRSAVAAAQAPVAQRQTTPSDRPAPAAHDRRRNTLTTPVNPWKARQKTGHTWFWRHGFTIPARTNPRWSTSRTRTARTPRKRTW
jgi:hypothetical protein